MWVSISKRLKHLNTVGSGRQGEVTNSIFQDDSIQFKSNLYTSCPIFSSSLSMKEEMKEYVISRQLLVMTHQLGRVISAVLNDVQSSGA